MNTKQRFVLYQHWIDSIGYEHRVKFKQGTLTRLNHWARETGLQYRPDSSLFGGYYLAPDGAWYTADILTK